MKVLTVRVGEVVEIGDMVAIKVIEKSGRRVGLAIATQLAPIRLVADGIIHSRFFSSGITGETKYIPRPQLAATG